MRINHTNGLLFVARISLKRNVQTKFPKISYTHLGPPWDRFLFLIASLLKYYEYSLTKLKQLNIDDAEQYSSIGFHLLLKCLKIFQPDTRYI